MSTIAERATAESSPRFAVERSGLRKHVELAAIRALGRLGTVPQTILGSRAAEPLGIITYHRVVDPLLGVPAPMHNVAPRRLEAQVAGLMRRGWSVWPLKRVLDAAAAGETIPRRTLVITFDDGFASVYDHAYPALARLKAPFTVFVNTGYLDGGDPFPFDLWGVDHRGRVPAATYRPLTSDQCLEMASSGLVELGAHTHTHEDFRGRGEAFRRDLETNVEQLKSRFGVSDPPFAFPYGSTRLGFTSDNLQAVAREVGVTCALTAMRALVDPASDPYSWGRFNVFSWDTSATLAAKLGGWFTWAAGARRWWSRSK